MTRGGRGPPFQPTLFPLSREALQYGNRGERSPRTLSTPPTHTAMSFIVRIVGLDDEGKGIWYPSEEEAKEYAEQATANGWQAVITPD